MTLAAKCNYEFDAHIKERGEEYFHGKLVSPVMTDDGVVEAAVEGSSQYNVVLDLRSTDDGVVSASCSCPHFARGFNCKHIWATILAADERGYTEGVSGPSRMSVEDVDDVDFDDDFGGQWTNSSGYSSSGAQGIGSYSGGTWYQQLEAAASSESRPAAGQGRQLRARTRLREVFYFIDVPASYDTNALILRLKQREMRKDGRWGKLKKLEVNANQIDDDLDPNDQALLELLVGNKTSTVTDFEGNQGGYFFYESTRLSQVQIAPAWYGAVLPQLCETGRLIWDIDDALEEAELQRVVWDAEGPWRFVMSIAADDDRKCWHVNGCLQRGDETRPIQEPVIVLGSGVVLFPEKIGRFDAGDDYPWLILLRRGGTLQIPYSDRERLLNEIWRSRRACELDLPGNLRLDQVTAAPIGSLVIHAPKRTGDAEDFSASRRLLADACFLYGEEPVDVDESAFGIVTPEAGRVLFRDIDREDELFAELTEAGVKPAERHWNDREDSPRLQLPTKQLQEIVDRLVRAGWHVEAEGRTVRAAGQFSMRVSTGIDWFELNGQLEFDGATAQLPAILAAVRRGDKYVTLDDGSRGLLPDDWLARYASLAELGEVADDHVRFSQSQALLLDALLAEQAQTVVDRRFKQYREKLQSFQGVEPRDPARGFQATLRPYQKQGLGWLHFLREFGLGGCLADDMGLGKTVQVLALLQARRQRRVSADETKRPSLVVVPKSLVFNWIAEAARFTPKLRMASYTGTERAVVLDDLDQLDVIVTTYGTLRRDIVKLKDIHFDYVILDEAQAIKNGGSQSAKACRLVQADHRLAMTGTPIENHLGELWSLFEFLNPGMLGRSTAFRALSKDSDAESKAALRDLATALAPFILRRTKEQVLTELPEKTEQTLYCEMEPSQRKIYNDIRDYYRASLDKKIQQVGLNRSKIHVLEALMRLRQAACHPGLLDRDDPEAESAKLDVLIDQLTEVVDEGHKALVFSQFTSFLAIVRKRLDDAGITYEYLDGRTRKRQERVERFQNDPACPVFLISLKAGGHGLNLTAADYVYILDPWWNPAVESQAIDRAYRIGQERHVFAYRLICRDTVEEKIVELQQSKRELADAIITADQGLLRSLSSDDLQLLLS